MNLLHTGQRVKGLVLKLSYSSVLDMLFEYTSAERMPLITGASFMFPQVTRIVLLWVNNHFNDFEGDPAMTRFLEEFEKNLEDTVRLKRIYLHGLGIFLIPK